jgi:integral membrane sensor domain MASE1
VARDLRGVNVTTAGAVLTALGNAAGNTLEGLLGAALLTRFAGGTRLFERAADAFRFLALAAVPGAAVSATLGVGSLAVTGHGRIAAAAPASSRRWRASARSIPLRSSRPTCWPMALSVASSPASKRRTRVHQTR